MTYEYAQAVMAAAGVKPSDSVCACGHCMAGHIYDGGALGGHGVVAGCSYCECAKWDRRDIYPDPLTSGDAFLALWDALEAKGWRVEFRTLLDGTLVQVYKADEMGSDLGSIFQGGDEDRRVALVEAAGQALGVIRG